MAMPAFPWESQGCIRSGELWGLGRASDLDFVLLEGKTGRRKEREEDGFC